MQRKVKRCLDLLCAVVFFFLLSPIFLISYVVLLFFMGEPVLFRQERAGLKGNPFVIYKFRTMTNQTEEDGSLLPDSARMTPIGKFLRRYSLDEIPQLWNVLIGEMSLVGPRPLLMEYLPLYSVQQARRHDVLPGITGWAQVNGRNAITWEEKFELDVWYVENWSLLLDIKILWLTIEKVFKREGISMAGQATTEKFTGYVEKE